MISVALQQLGFSEKEISVYLASLRLGPSSVRKIADEAMVNRGTTYDILKSLVNKGLVSYYHQSKHQYFIAEDPQKLTDLIDEKYHEVLEARGRIHAIIPQLKSIYNNAQEKPVVKFYEGHAGAKTILQDVIESFQNSEQKEYYVYSSPEVRELIYRLYPNFSKDRVKAGIYVKVISTGPGGKERGLDERRWMPGKRDFPTYMILYNGNIAVITAGSDEKPLGFIIKDKNIYTAHKSLFDFIWNLLQ